MWLLNNLLYRYQVVPFPTNAGWAESNIPTGGVNFLPRYLYPYTGVGANSRGLAWTQAYGFRPAVWSEIDLSKPLMLSFLINKDGNDVESVGRVQLKQVFTEGQLAAPGIGLQVDNFTVTGEAYGTARQTVALGNIVAGQINRIDIVVVPNTRVEFWVNNVLTGSLTGTAVPTLMSALFVISIINGATGTVDSRMFVLTPTIIHGTYLP